MDIDFFTFKFTFFSSFCFRLHFFFQNLSFFSKPVFFSSLCFSLSQNGFFSFRIFFLCL